MSTLAERAADGSRVIRDRGSRVASFASRISRLESLGGVFGERRYLIPRPNGPSKRWAQSPTALAQHHVRVVEVVRETPEAVTLVLEPTNGKALPFRAGQYLTHCFDVHGATVKRAYSICVPEGKRVACTVKAIDGGVVSAFAQAEVGVGYEYTVLGPSGDFVLPADDDAPLTFLAAGSGITPVISMIETALHREPRRHIRLVYASRGLGGIIFRVRLAALVAEYPHLTVEHVLSQPDHGWGGETGRLTGERAAALLRPSPTAHVFLCGPTELMEAASTALQVEGVARDRIHVERFFAAPHHTSSVPTEPQTVVFQGAGRTITQRPGETVLEAGLRNGVKLDFSCTVGGCAACKLRVLEGEVTVDEPNCLTADERADGYVLSCSAYAQTNAVIDA